MLRTIMALALTFTLDSAAKPTTLESTVSEIHLFKNGLAAIRRTVDLPGPGSYQINHVPEPVHGTFWVSGPEAMTVRTALEDVEIPFTPNFGGDLQKELTGKQVTIFFREGEIPPVTGNVLATAPATTPAWPPTVEISAAPEPFLVLEVGADRVYVANSMIAYANVRDASTTTTETHPVLTLETGDTAAATTVDVSYLAHGISWAPAYRVDIFANGTLTIAQQAVIKNELEDITGANVDLVSGYPGIEFARVTSPLATQVSWSQFFQQLRQRSQAYSDHVLQQAVLSNAIIPMDTSFDLTAIPTGDGPDMHYQNVGTRTLKKGESMLFEVASASAPYKRLVEWRVPDTRDPDGRPLYMNQAPEPSDDDSPWDVLEFQNPFDFPMTTAPAIVTANGRTLGQNMSHWTNRGETTRLRVTKALSIRTAAEEHEVEGAREHVVVGGRDYLKTTVEGTLRIGNNRAETVDLLVRRRFSGELLDASGDAETRLLEEGAWSANRRNELHWKLTLAPGQEHKLNYRYTILVLE